MRSPKSKLSFHFVITQLFVIPYMPNSFANFILYSEPEKAHNTSIFTGFQGQVLYQRGFRPADLVQKPIVWMQLAWTTERCRGTILRLLCSIHCKQLLF